MIRLLAATRVRGRIVAGPAVEVAPAPEAVSAAAATIRPDFLSRVRQHVKGSLWLFPVVGGIAGTAAGALDHLGDTLRLIGATLEELRDGVPRQRRPAVEREL
jgi:hypothetical protein